MQFLKKIFDFYIFSNVHVALAGFCLTKITLLKFGNSTNLTPLFVAFSIIVSYNFIRFYEIKTDSIIWLKIWFLNHTKSLLILTLIAILGLIYILMFTYFSWLSLIILFPFLIMTLFYVVPLFKFRKLEISFRNFPGVKIFSIAIAWAGVSVLFPVYEAGFQLTSEVYIEFLQRFFILISITIPFDIRDVNSDSKKMKTLPQILGIKASKWLGFSLLLLFLICDFFKENVSTTEALINIGISIITSLFLCFSSPEKSRYYTGFWVEAIPVFWFVLIVLFL